MTIRTKSLADLLPAQEHYYLLHDGVKFAKHGTPEADGLLVFENREGANQFCQTVGMALPAFQPVMVDAEDFLRLVEEVGAVCMIQGRKVVVGTLRPRKSKPDTQTGSGPLPANPEGVVPGNSLWLPADQIPAFLEAQFDDDVLPCGCPVDPLEIEEARASRIEELRVAAWDDRDYEFEILEGGSVASLEIEDERDHEDKDFLDSNNINKNELATDLDGMESRNYSHVMGEYGDDHTVEDENDRDFPGTPDRDWVGEECDNPEGIVEQDSISVPVPKCPDNAEMVRAVSVKDVIMSPSNDKVFVNSSEEEHREAIRSAAYLLGAFGGLGNAREYLSQVSESLGHVPPRMPEGRPKWVALTREQFAADLEEMFRQALEPEPVNPECVVPEDSNWEPAT